MKTISISIVPTMGSYQSSKSATLIRETATLWVVQVEGEMGEWRFSKKDSLRTGFYKYYFPCYMIDIKV